MVAMQILSETDACQVNRSLGRRWAAFVALTLVAFTLLGCPSQQLITEVPTVEDADGQQATCKVARDPLNPLVVEWPGTAKVDLESASRRGLVAVSYAGCTMKILTSCQIEGGYDLESTTPARDRIEISDNNELYAKLPLGAASLKGELSTGSSLELDYIAVGQRVANDSPKASKGDCQDATHFVRTITVGAFRLDARAKGKVGASVEVGSAGGGIGRDEAARNLRSQGDIDICAKKPDSPECGAILQLGLAPLNKNKGQTMASAGFGAGLDPVAQLETVDALELDNATTTNLASVDVDLYELLDVAVRAEKNTSYAASDRVRAWENLANYKDKKGGNPLKTTADERLEAWRIRESQEQRQREALERLKSRYLEDKAKLDRLLALGDEVIKPDQKESYKKEFNEVYGARSKELASIGLSTDASVGINNNGGGSTPTPDSGTPSSGEGLLGFGFLQIDADIGYAGVGTSYVGIERAGIGQKATFQDATSEDSSLSPGNLMLGAMISTPELLPGAFCKDSSCFQGGLGLYGSFKAFLTGDATTIAAAGGARFDFRLTPESTLNLGGGGGYGMMSGKFENCPVPTAPATTCPDGNEYLDLDGLAGPLADLFAGIGYNDRLFSFGLRSTIDIFFLSNDNVPGTRGVVTDIEPDGFTGLEPSSMVTFTFGGHVGITL